MFQASQLVRNPSTAQRATGRAVTLVDDLMSEYGGRIAGHVLTKSSDLLFFAGPCTGGSSWARLNKTRGIDTAEKIKAKQKMLFGRFVEIKRHAMTKHAAILFELPGSCDYWKGAQDCTSGNVSEEEDNEWDYRDNDLAARDIINSQRMAICMDEPREAQGMAGFKCQGCGGCSRLGN